MGTPIYCWHGCKLAYPLQKSVWKFLKTLKIEQPYGPSIPLLEIYPKDSRSTHLRDAWIFIFIGAHEPSYGISLEAHQ